MAGDYYKILGLEKNASKEEIKKAFRKKAHEYHPDKKSGDEAKFKEVNEAYGVLSDEKKRAEYDAYGRVFSGAGAGAGGTQGAGFDGFDFSNFAQGFGGQNIEFDLGDIFGDIFGGGGRTKRGRDISIDVEIEFQESVFGTQRKVLLTKPSVCEHCSGTGAEPGTGTKTCPTCNGQGKIRDTKQSILGTFATVRQCPECHGSGTIPETKCDNCKGTGVKKEQKEITVKVPAGIDDGEMIRMSGIGEAVPGGNAGDLYIKVHVKPHPTVRKEGANLVMELPVKLTDALLGAKYSVETLEGTIDVKIPERVASGELLRVRGKGVPTSRGRGDLLLRVRVTLPEKLSKKVKKIIEDLREEGI